MSELEKVERITIKIVERLKSSALDEKLRAILISLAEIGFILYSYDHNYQEFNKNIEVIEIWI